MVIPDSRVVKSRLQTTPWAVTVAASAGLMSFLVCRKLFKQTKEAALLQAFVVVTSTLGALESASKSVPVRSAEPERPPVRKPLPEKAPKPVSAERTKNGAVKVRRPEAV